MKKPLLSLLTVLLAAAQATAFVPPADRTSGNQQKASLLRPRPPALTTTTLTITSNTASSTKLQAVPAVSKILPLSQKIFLSSLLPTCLGFWKSAYGDSYAYGIATALISFWIYQYFATSIKALAVPSLAWLIKCHAGALMCVCVFCGIRVVVFLLYRELCTQNMKESVKEIEVKTAERWSRPERTLFLVLCASLYFGLCAPLLLTCHMATTKAVVLPKFVLTTAKTMVGLMWGGFVFAAVGDFNKSIVKAIKGEYHLVTGGLYALCRHPNYTGDLVGWTSNGILAVLAGGVLLGTEGAMPILKLIGYVTASVLGVLLLDFVLLGATNRLEKHQKETHGDSERYKAWVEKTWTGFGLPTKNRKVHVEPEIEVEDIPEEGGTGI